MDQRQFDSIGRERTTAAPPRTTAPSVPLVRPRAQPPLAAVIQRARVNPRALTRADVAQLHRSLGNAAVGRLLAGAAVPNRTGLPDGLKAEVEAASGLPMDDVRVHLNSPEPAAVQAHAYARGTEIHLGPGQEAHLPHEAWHVVQQKQGRVRPTMQVGDAAVNDDDALEREASDMGRTTAGGGVSSALDASRLYPSVHSVVQRVRTRKGKGQGAAAAQEQRVAAEVNPTGTTGLAVRLTGPIAGMAIGYLIYHILKPQIDAALGPVAGPLVLVVLGAVLGGAVSPRRAAARADPSASDDGRTRIRGPGSRSASGLGRGTASGSPRLEFQGPSTLSGEGSSSSTDSKVEATSVPRRMFLDDADPRPSVRVTIDADFGSSGAHHPTLTFRIEGLDPRSFNYESWIKSKMSDTVELAVSDDDRRYAKEITANWGNLNKSIIEYFYDDLIKRDVAGKMDTNHFRRRNINMTLLLLSANQDIRRRLNDVNGNCPVPKIGRVGGVLSDIYVNWFAILAGARGLMKRRALRERCPPKDEIRLIHDAVQEYEDGSLQPYLTAEGIFNSDIVINAEPKKGVPGVNFGLGHLRWIIYLEWKMIRQIAFGE